MGGLKFIIVHRLEASPGLVRVLERFATGGTPPEVTEALGRIEAHMATIREMLDALRVGVERNEAFAVEIDQLKADRDRIAMEEAEEDRLEEVEDREHAAQVEAWTQERAALQERIAFLEAQSSITDSERDELADLIARLNSGGPTVSTGDEPPPPPVIE